MAPNHVRERKATQPCLRSASMLVAVVRPATAGRQRLASIATLTRKVPASMATAVPGPAVATITPASAGPATELSNHDRACRALPCARISPVNICGKSPDIAGVKKAAPAPQRASSTTSSQRCQWPATSRAATAACTAHRTTSATSITRRRGHRSATVPPKSSSRTMAAVPAPSTQHPAPSTQHPADLSRRPAPVEDGKADRHRRRGVAQRGERLPGKEQAVVPLAQSGEPPGQAHELRSYPCTAATTAMLDRRRLLGLGNQVGAVQAGRGDGGHFKLGELIPCDALGREICHDGASATFVPEAAFCRSGHH